MITFVCQKAELNKTKPTEKKDMQMDRYIHKE